ncbi:MAG TPA: zinc-binding dehydrogenase [Promicromonospora sp.]|nr:zinc-binding dehydrogenase [Promicromonospora sp.]
MRAVTIDRFGDPSGLTVRETPAPAPGPGELALTVEAAGVAGVDAVIRRGTISSGLFPAGTVLGSEAAGTVTAVGDGVPGDWVGRRVWAFTGYGGAYAEQAVARLDDVTELPEGLSPVDAVTIGSAGPVAHFGLAHVHHAEGESVLVRGAAGSIGIAAVELAARAGVVAVTTSSAERGERLRTLGATYVLDRSGAGDAPETYDVIVDIAGGPTTADYLDRLAPNGRMVLVGAVAGMPPGDLGARLLESFQQSRSVATFSLNTVPVEARNGVRAEHLAAVARGDLHAVVHDVLPLDRAAEAHRRMDDGEVFGRIVLVP